MGDDHFFIGGGRLRRNPMKIEFRRRQRFVFEYGFECSDPVGDSLKSICWGHVVGDGIRIRGLAGVAPG